MGAGVTKEGVGRGLAGRKYSLISSWERGARTRPKTRKNNKDMIKIQRPEEIKETEKRTPRNEEKKGGALPSGQKWVWRV